MTEKMNSKWASLTTVLILGQTPRYHVFPFLFDVSDSIHPEPLARHPVDSIADSDHTRFSSWDIL